MTTIAGRLRRAMFVLPLVLLGACSSGAHAHSAGAATAVASVPCPTGSSVPLAGIGTTRLPCLIDAGRQVAIGASAGRPEVINLWASWCGPCRQEATLLQAAHAATGDRVLFIGIDSQDERAAALDFLAASGATYPQAFDEQARFAAAVGAVGLPYTVFVDASGMIVYHQIGALTPKSLQTGLARSMSATSGSD
ncbi:MAG TPA: TlpA disulfide reductase family protein [Micromonosporaceae bacterium]|nr:TlpA disulfide reductase family protein [Micromonosporaceae bacterium]